LVQQIEVLGFFAQIMASSKMLEGYCVDIEQLLRESSVRQALRLAVALPEMCSALESPRLRSSPADYVRWCERWLKGDRWRLKRVTGTRLYRLFSHQAPASKDLSRTDTRAHSLVRLRMRRNVRSHRALGRVQIVRPSGRLEAFQLALCEALLAAARAWYSDDGQKDPVVQLNLGRLTVR
jgi:hypothetical protein